MRHMTRSRRSPYHIHKPIHSPSGSRPSEHYDKPSPAIRDTPPSRRSAHAQTSNIGDEIPFTLSLLYTNAWMI
ncbi:hypothetical protein FKM82_023622 [Ascaphus truei]